MLDPSVRCCFLLLVPMLVSACASSFATKVTPGAELEDYRTYYVEKHAADDRRIDMTIRGTANGDLQTQHVHGNVPHPSVDQAIRMVVIKILSDGDVRAYLAG